MMSEDIGLAKVKILNKLLEMKKNLDTGDTLSERDDWRDRGICQFIAREAGCYLKDRKDYQYCLDCLWLTWEHYSGCDAYPVPSTVGCTDRGLAHDAYELSDNLWDQNTEYGRLRVNLLEHCIKQLQHDTKQEI